MRKLEEPLPGRLLQVRDEVFLGCHNLVTTL